MSDVTVNPVKITSAMSATYKNTAGHGHNNVPLYIEKVYWQDYTLGDTFTVTDGSATPNTIVTFTQPTATTAATTNVVFPFTPPKYVADFQVTTISAGSTLWIYLH